VSTLRDLLSYDCETGTLKWEVRDRKYFACDWSFKVWNKRYPNTVALNTKHAGSHCAGRIFDKGYLAHRVAWALHYGEWPDGEVDHIDGDGENNRISNLRVVTSSENSMNTKVHGHNTSGHIGVYFEIYTNRWVASAERRGKRVKARFKSKQEAIDHREKLSRELGFHENHGKR